MDGSTGLQYGSTFASRRRKAACSRESRRDVEKLAGPLFPIWKSRLLLVNSLCTVYRCSTRATYIKPFTASFDPVHSSFYISLYLSYKFSLSDSRHIFLGLAACVKICSLPYGMLLNLLFFSRSYFACMNSGIPSPRSRGVLCQTG